MIHPTAIVEEGCVLGQGSKVWHFSHLMSGAVIGQNCNIGQNVVIMPNARLGNGCKVQNNVSLYTGVVCEDYVFLGPSCVFTNVINPRAFIERKSEYRPTLLQEGVSVGANATILCGITIGSFAMIGAGTVVIRNVLPYALVVGNPARQIGWVSRAGHRLTFDKKQEATCPETGERYRMKSEGDGIERLD